MTYKIKCNIGGVKFRYKEDNLENITGRFAEEYRKGIQKQKIYSGIGILADIGFGCLLAAYEGNSAIEAMGWFAIGGNLMIDFNKFVSAYSAELREKTKKVMQYGTD